MLEARQVTVRRQGRAILDDVSIAMPSGTLTVIAGPNGAGKSTLFGVLTGALRPDLGQAILDDRALDFWPARELAKRRAVLAQHASLGFPLSVVEVVTMGRGPFVGHSSRDLDVQLAGWALERTGTSHLAGRTYTTLSGGERQRVQLARVLVQICDAGAEGSLAGRYLMLDEPTSSLDLPHQHVCLSIARDLAQRGGGVVVVLHDLNLAAMFADRICLMENGCIVAAGSPEQVLDEPLLERVFGLPLRVTPHPTRGCRCVLAA